MKIPTFEEAKQALIEKRGTPLDRFVAYWEPEGKEDEKFRDMLDDALHYVVETLRKEKEMAEKVKEVPGIIRSDWSPWFFWNPRTNTYEEKK